MWNRLNARRSSSLPPARAPARRSASAPLGGHTGTFLSLTSSWSATPHLLAAQTSALFSGRRPNLVERTWELWDRFGDKSSNRNGKQHLGYWRVQGIYVRHVCEIKLWKNVKQGEEVKSVNNVRRFWRICRRNSQKSRLRMPLTSTFFFCFAFLECDLINRSILSKLYLAWHVIVIDLLYVDSNHCHRVIGKLCGWQNDDDDDDDNLWSANISMLQQHAYDAWAIAIIKVIIFVAYGACWVCLCCHNSPNSDRTWKSSN